MHEGRHGVAIELFKVSMDDGVAVPLVASVLKSGYIGQGPKVEEFEQLIKRHLGNDHVLTVNSCTSGLELATHLLKTEQQWEADAEVLMPPMTCFATASAVLANNVRIKWADIDETLNIDLADVRRKLTEKTRCLMLVHWGGHSIDMLEVARIQEEYREMFGRDLPVIEDCAHAWGSRFRGEWTGTHGNISVFSFQAIKSLTTGDGGAMVLPQHMYRRAKLLRWFGLDRDAGQSFRCVQNIREPGFKYHLNDIAAVIGIANFERSLADVRRHQDNARFYQNNLTNVPGLKVIDAYWVSEASFWLYTVHVQDRKNFIRHMTDNGVAVSPVHARCDTHDCVRDFRTMLPSLDQYGESMVCIPVGWWVTDDDRQMIVDTIAKGW